MIFAKEFFDLQLAFAVDAVGVDCLAHGRVPFSRQNVQFAWTRTTPSAVFFPSLMIPRGGSGAAGGTS